MSSPFAAFRKNQKMMMAILGVMVMIAFLILPPLLDYGRQAGVVDDVVVTTRYGALKESDLYKLAERRRLANQFIYNAMQKANLRPYESYFGLPTENSLVETMLLAKKADELGFKVPNDRVVYLLNRLTQETVDAAGMAEIAGQLRRQESEIMDALRYEMMAQQYAEMQYVGVQIGTPYDRWQQYESLNREMAVEVIPLPVDNYLVKVKDPTDAELQAFFEKYENAEMTVRSGEPGFRQPKRAAFEYFRIKLSDFVSQVNVTDEEIAAVYERDREQYRIQPETNPYFDPNSLPPDANAPPAEAPVAPATESEVPADAAPSTETPAPNETASPATETPPAEAPAGETPAAETPAQPEATPETKPQSSVRRSPFHLASMKLQQDEQPPAATDTPAEAPTGEATPATDTPPPSDVPPADATTGAPPIDEPLAPEEQIPVDTLQDFSPPKYRPLSEVREQIRRQIAEAKARPLMEQVIRDLGRDMRKYESQYRGWQSLKKQQPDAAAPKSLDFGDLARKYGVEAKQTPLLAADALLFSDEYTLGKSMVGQGRSQRDLVAVTAYSSLPIFQMQESHDAQGDMYLFWKTEEKDAYAPTFEEVRGDVLDAWKREEARKLAVAEAEKLAEQARQSKKSLREAFADRADLPVTAPPPFTWKWGGFMLGSQEIPVRMSNVEGVPDAGDAFMRAVYGLDIGEVGVALDATKSTAYLIRLENSTPDLNVLHTMFLGAPYSDYARAGMDAAQQRQMNWRQELDTQADVNWLRAPREL